MRMAPLRASAAPAAALLLCRAGAAAAAGSAASKLQLHSMLSSHMVLARAPLAARVWGNATAGATVTVALRGVGSWASPPAAPDGAWSVELPAQPPGAGHSLSVSDGVTTVTLDDVAFGDVYLCTGQSNMEFSLNAATNASAEIADSVNYPDLRLATVLDRPSATPQRDVPSIANYSWPSDGNRTAGYVWRRSEPDAFAPASSGTGFTYFSAVCYLFGRDLYKALGGVPVGLVASYVGGVKIETLMSPEALLDDSCGGTAYRAPNISTAVAARIDHSPRETAGLGAGPGDVWNGMIYPLLPMRFTGVAFYQGESNSLAGCPSAYACLFPSLISDWRRKFGLPDLGFFFVQLAAYGWHDYTHLRQAQTAAMQLPGVGMATAIDLGDMKSPNGGIHPRLKAEVGRRLALAARAVQYLEPGVQHEGPRMEGVYLSNGAGTAATLTFAVSTAHNLHLSGTAGCTDCCKTPNTKPWFAAFETQAPNGTWAPAAAASVRRNQVTLTSPAPISGVRHGWGGMPDCMLYNGDGGAMDHAGIVAPPFRRCLYGAAADLPAWSWLSDCAPAPAAGVAFSAGGGAVATSSAADFILSGAAVVGGAPDAASTGAAVATGAPKGAAALVVRSAIGCGDPARARLLDRVELRLRYRAAPRRAVGDAAAVLKVSLVNADTKPVAVVGTVELGNFSGASGYSAPVRVGAAGLAASCGGGPGSNPRGRLFVQLAVTNNDRPVVIPLDDLAGGFRLSVAWS